VLFIFIVSNCGGVLTPIGDPPLFIGFLKGVPFEWTLFHCFPAWMLCIGLLLAVFFVLDSLAARKDRVARRKAETQIFIDQPDSAPTPEKGVKVALSGLSTLFFLFLVLFGVFFDRLIEDLLGVKTELPLGAVLQLAAAAAAYRCASRGNLEANRFSFLPIKEVALLFVGIFAAMVPALDYLRQHAEQLGMMTPTAFFWTAGALSSFLDNAPTYYTFLETAHGLADLEPGPDATRAWLALQAVGQTGYPAAKLLLAISLAAVFFGANTYIGNGPNFMIKAIGEEAGVPMPTFFGYLLKYSLPIMLPVLFLVWLVFVR
jgi:Na+/H+ antiporter NhaD/arsenite permease-like protein